MICILLACSVSTFPFFSVFQLDKYHEQETLVRENTFQSELHCCVVYKHLQWNVQNISIDHINVC